MTQGCFNDLARRRRRPGEDVFQSGVVDGEFSCSGRLEDAEYVLGVRCSHFDLSVGIAKSGSPETAKLGHRPWDTCLSHRCDLVEVDAAWPGHCDKSV